MLYLINYKYYVYKNDNYELEYLTLISKDKIILNFNDIECFLDLICYINKCSENNLDTITENNIMFKFYFTNGKFIDKNYNILINNILEKYNISLNSNNYKLFDYTKNFKFYFYNYQLFFKNEYFNNILNKINKSDMNSYEKYSLFIKNNNLSFDDEFLLNLYLKKNDNLVN